MNQSSKPSQLVLLLHGIRTRAWWQGALSVLLERETGATVIPIKYGRFDLFRFLLPFPFLKKSTVLRIERSIEDALHQYPGSEVTVIAHSFGTYALSEILFSNPRIRLRRVVLCGAIIRKDFPWDRLYSQFSESSKRKTIINECGLRDIWPLMAESMTWGYGASGVDGFGTVGVRDRYHDVDHSAFLTEEFARKYWLPLIRDDEIVIPEVEAVGGQPRSLLSLLRFPYRYLIGAAVLGVVFAAALPIARSLVQTQSSFEVEQGLAKFDAPTRSLMMYSAAPGGVAFDVNNVNGITSPFSYAISQALRDGSTDVNYIAPKVRDSVAAQTNGIQIPYYENALGVSLNLADRNFNKIALLVGNVEYEHAPKLATPLADVLSISKSFRELGFITIIATDVSRGGLEKAIESLKDIVEDSNKPTIVAFYYSGHGVQIDHISYMVPVDADISSERMLLDQVISIENVVDTLASSAAYTLILIDACRNDPFSADSLAKTKTIPTPFDPIMNGFNGFTILADDEDLVARVEGFLQRDCIACHSSSNEAPNLIDLDYVASSGSIVVPGSPGESIILEVLKSGKPHYLVNVSEPDLEALECWIFRGAKTKSQQSEKLRGLTIIPADSVC